MTVHTVLKGSVYDKCLSDAMYVTFEGPIKHPPLQLIFTSLGHQSGTEASSANVVSSEDLSVNTSLA